MSVRRNATGNQGGRRKDMRKATGTALIVGLVAAAMLAGCKSGGGSEEETGSGGSSQTGTGTGPATWFFAVRATDSDGHTSNYSDEVSGDFAAGETATVMWDTPTKRVNGECLNELPEFVIAYGTRSSAYSYQATVSIPNLQCPITSSDPACGDIRTCEYTTPPLGS